MEWLTTWGVHVQVVHILTVAAGVEWIKVEMMMARVAYAAFATTWGRSRSSPLPGIFLWLLSGNECAPVERWGRGWKGGAH